jgi:hypothetical protein
MKLKNDNDIVFILLCLLGHDFFHDFNIVNFKDRFKVIKKEIATLQRINAEFVTRFNGQYEQNITTIEPLLPREPIEGGAKEKENFSEEDGLPMSDINTQYEYLYLGELNNEYYNIPGVTTRQTTKTYDTMHLMIEFIYETKLYVLGYFYNSERNISGGSKKGGREPISTFENYLSKKRVKTKKNKSLDRKLKSIGINQTFKKSPSISKKKIKSPSISKIKLKSPIQSIKLDNNVKYEFFKKSIRMGFFSVFKDIENLFKEVSSEPESVEYKNCINIKNYFLVMFKLYLLCECDEIHPLDIFNNIIIDSTLFQIILDSTFNFEEEVTKIREIIQVYIF